MFISNILSFIMFYHIEWLSEAALYVDKKAHNTFKYNYSHNNL